MSEDVISVKGRPMRKRSLKWLRAHFPTTPGMEAPDYVIVNGFVDRIHVESTRMARRGDRLPLESYATAFGYLSAQLDALARDVPGVVEWLHNNTPPVSLNYSIAEAFPTPDAALSPAQEEGL